MAIEDVGAEAESVIKSIARKNNYGQYEISLKTNQIRKILTAVNSLTNRISVYKITNETATELTEELAAEVKYLKVKIAYQVGRDKARGNPVKNFVDKAEFFKRIDAIGKSVDKYESFARYVESLVAYHKFYGGRDN